ncbi:MAG: M55 family metallopeptidase [Vicinamibacterales bacterium]
MPIPFRPAVIRTLAAAAVAAILPAPIAAQRPLKLFISIDMEGITGVVQPAQLGPGPEGWEYARAREWMTGEARAAIERAKAAGATELVIADSHGNMQNLLIDQLPEEVRIVRGSPRPLSMMQGIDGTFAGAIFIGYHASEYGTSAVRGHTMSSARLLHVKLNGVEVGEGVWNAAIAGSFGVPVLFISGDRAAVEQFRHTVTTAEGVVVKEGLGYHAAVTTTPARGQRLIREGVERAIRRIGEMKPYVVRTPLDLEVGFKLTLDAERISYIPGLRRVDAHAVAGSLPDMTSAAKLLQIMSSLALP